MSNAASLTSARITEQTIHHSVNNKPVKRPPLVARLPPAFYIGPHAVWNHRQLYKAHAKINGKIENSTPCKIVTHEDFNLKLGTRDYVAEATHHATLESNRPSGGFPPNRGNIKPVWLFWLYCFFSPSSPQVEPSHWSLRWMVHHYPKANHHHHSGFLVRLLQPRP